jgi:hypothetical protein
MNRSMVVAAALIFATMVAPITAQAAAAADATTAKAALCFNFSEGNNLAARLRLIWIPRATPCRPVIESYGLE